MPVSCFSSVSLFFILLCYMFFSDLFHTITWGIGVPRPFNIHDVFVLGG